MKIQKATAVLVVVFGMNILGTTGWSETKKHAQKRNDSSSQSTSPVRFKTVAGTPDALPPNFKTIPEALKEVSDGKPVVAWCGTGYLINDGVAEKLLKHFETLRKYREELEKCSDEASTKLKSFLDEYVSKMDMATRTPENISAVSKPYKSLQGMDSALRFHESIKEFLAKKGKEITTGKEKFEKADDALTTALDGILKWCVATDNEFKPSADPKTTQQIEDFNAQTKKLTFDEGHACEIKVDEILVGQNSSQSQEGEKKDEKKDESKKDESKKEDPKKPIEPTTAPPTIEEVKDGKEGKEGKEKPSDRIAQDQSASTQQPPPPGGPGAASLPLPSAGAGFIPAQGDAQLQNPDFFNNATEREDELTRQLLQLAQNTQRPNESRVGGSPSRDNSRSFQFPPVNVSPSQPYPQQQQQPYPQMQQPMMPYGAMMQPQQPVPFPAELYGPRSTDSSSSKTSAAVDAAATQSLLEMARLQQQLMQAQMAANANNNMQNQRGGYYNRITGGGRTAFRGAQGSQSGRYVGRSRTGTSNRIISSGR